MSTDLSAVRKKATKRYDQFLESVDFLQSTNLISDATPPRVGTLAAKMISEVYLPPESFCLPNLDDYGHLSIPQGILRQYPEITPVIPNALRKSVTSVDRSLTLPTPQQIESFRLYTAESQGDSTAHEQLIFFLSNETNLANAAEKALDDLRCKLRKREGAAYSVYSLNYWYSPTQSYKKPSKCIAAGAACRPLVSLGCKFKQYPLAIHAGVLLHEMVHVQQHKDSKTLTTWSRHPKTKEQRAELPAYFVTNAIMNLMKERCMLPGISLSFPTEALRRKHNPDDKPFAPIKDSELELTFNSEYSLPVDFVTRHNRRQRDEIIAESAIHSLLA